TEANQRIDEITDPKTGLVANVKSELADIKSDVNVANQRIDELTDTKTGIFAELRQQIAELNARIAELEAGK
ncbi:MAG: hypothetical protein LUD00_08740, partial [Prevotellaceae bacterium]|nr:hypothetical protein [Prevotellaceae bacterium]